jgi:hypothetical protein
MRFGARMAPLSLVKEKIALLEPLREKGTSQVAIGLKSFVFESEELTG